MARRLGEAQAPSLLLPIVIGAIWDDWWAWLLERGQELIAWLEEHWTGFWAWALARAEEFLVWLQEKSDVLLAWLNAKAEEVTAWIKARWRELEEFIEWFRQNAWAFIESWGDYLEAWLGERTRSIANWLGYIAENIEYAWEHIILGFGTLTGDTARAVWVHIQNLADSVTDFWAQADDWLEGKLGEVKEELKVWLDSLLPDFDLWLDWVRGQLDLFLEGLREEWEKWKKEFWAWFMEALFGWIVDYLPTDEELAGQAIDIHLERFTLDTWKALEAGGDENTPNTEEIWRTAKREFHLR